MKLSGTKFPGEDAIVPIDLLSPKFTKKSESLANINPSIMTSGKGFKRGWQLLLTMIILGLNEMMALGAQNTIPKRIDPASFHMGFGKRSSAIPDPASCGLGLGKRLNPADFHMGFGKRASLDPAAFHMGFGKRASLDPAAFHMGFGKRASLDPAAFHMGFGKRASLDPAAFHMGFGKR